MVRTEREFNIAKPQLASVRAALEDNRTSLADEGYTLAEVEAGVSQLVSSEAELSSGVAFYEDAIQGNFERLSHHGRGALLIALRIHRGVSQKEMADLPGVSEAQVSRDERGEYYNITDERASRIAQVLGKEPTSQLRDLAVEPAKELEYFRTARRVGDGQSQPLFLWISYPMCGAVATPNSPFVLRRECGLGQWRRFAHA